MGGKERAAEMSNKSQPLSFFHFLGIDTKQAVCGSSLPSLREGDMGGRPQLQPTSVLEPMAATDTKTLDGHTLSTRVTPAQDMQECGGFLIRVITQGLSETPLHALAIK